VREILWAATPTPTPTAEFDPNLVTPGVVGFIVTFGIILATVVILISMNRRVRRLNYRAQIAERLDAEESASDD
jgi:hypothetical protein